MATQRRRTRTNNPVVDAGLHRTLRKWVGSAEFQSMSTRSRERFLAALLLSRSGLLSPTERKAWRKELGLHRYSQ